MLRSIATSKGLPKTKCISFTNSYLKVELLQISEGENFPDPIKQRDMQPILEGKVLNHKLLHIEIRLLLHLKNSHVGDLSITTLIPDSLFPSALRLDNKKLETT